MKEINLKYRGLNKLGDSEKFVYGTLTKDLKGSTAYYDTHPYRIHRVSGTARKNKPVLTETIGKYTGINDSDGNELYEGDILSVNGGEVTITLDIYGVVCFLSDDGRCEDVITLGSRGMIRSEGGNYIIDDVKIIGNIHQNRLL